MASPPIDLDFEWSGAAVSRDGFRLERGASLTGESVLRMEPMRPQHRAALRREIELGSWLVRALAAADYPRELSRLVGFDSPTEPGLVVITYPGRPMSEYVELPRTLSAAERNRITMSLLTAVELLRQAGVVHRAISPDHLLWDGAGVQVTGFAQAVRVHPAVPRADGPVRAPWSPPEQRRGEGRVDVADDAYGVAAVLFWLYTNEFPGEAADMATRLAVQSEDLNRRLAGAFAPAARDRPDIAELRRRWQPATPTLARTLAFEREDREARSAFADLRRRQAGERHLALVSAPMFADQPITGTRALDLLWRSRRLLLVVGGMVALVTVLLLLVGAGDGGAR